MPNRPAQSHEESPLERPARPRGPTGMDADRLSPAIPVQSCLMNTEFYAFGEILWDCLPSGRHAGGAPFNVAADLVQLGASASLISAVGQDPLGEEILEVARHKGVNVQFVSRARLDLPTGTVVATVDPLRQCDLRARAAGRLGRDRRSRGSP